MSTALLTPQSPCKRFGTCTSVNGVSLQFCRVQPLMA
jgi:hypothetical protein